MFHKPLLVHCIILTGLYFVNAQFPDCETDNVCPKDLNDIWNQTTMTAAQLSSEICYQTCPLSTTTLPTNNTCFNADCFPCDCERPRCEIYGTCCPDALRDGQQSASMFDVQRKTLKCISSVTEHYLFISSCPRNYSDGTIRNLCETENFDPSKIVEMNTRVSDSRTGVAYLNLYCAICNNVTEFESWNISINCDHYLNVYKATTETELLKFSLQKDSDCFIRDLPVNNHYVDCKSSWYENTINSCNVTEKWVNYDSEVEYNCLNNFYELHRIISVEEIVFKNIFCAICNLETPIRTICSLVDGITQLPPFALLLNFRNRIPTYQNFETQFLDCINGHTSQSECPIIQCTDGRIYSKHRCVTSLSRISGLGYKLELVYDYHTLDLIRKENVTLDSMENVLSSLRDWMKETLRDWAMDTSMVITISCAKASNKLINCCLQNTSGEYKKISTVSPLTCFTNALTLSLYYFNVYFIADARHGRDEIENNLAQVLSLGEIKISFSGNSLGLKYVSGDATHDNIRYCVRNVSGVCLTTGNIQTPLSPNFYNLWNLKDKFLTLTPVLTCAYVTYNQSDFKVETMEPEMPWRKKITLRLEKTSLIIKSHKELTKLALINNNTLKICVDLLQNKIAQLLKDRVKNSILFYQYILTLLCLSISIVCLLLTMFVYFNFSILRNVPGLHNMFLSASLLLSQVSLLASSHVSFPSGFCTFLGILTHFFWLNMFCWSFLCCFHMYSVFKAKNRSQLSRDNKCFFFRRIALSVLVPAIVISCVVIYAFLSSDGQRMGYGQSSCYLNSSELIVYSLGIPIAFIVLCDMYFFFSSVYEIYKIKQLQNHVSFKRKERKQMCVYVKLSTLTGVFWTVAILSESLDNDPLRFIAIVLNGLQGLFIFVSYICNRRILILCRQWFGKLKTHTSTDTVTTDQGISTINNNQ